MAERQSMRRSTGKVATSKALRHSAVWACRRLRADLVSTMPVDTYRMVGKTRFEVPKPPVFIIPGGEEVDWCEWAYSSTGDLDTSGNTAGVITARGADGKPSRIELFPFEEASLKGKGAKITEWRIGGETYAPDQIWHEKQHTSAGLPVGLSPIAHAAVSIGGYLSAQEFASDWFSGGGIPRARLKNVKKVLEPGEADKVNTRFRAMVGNGGLFVHGADWEYEAISAKASETQFIEQMQFGITDICRFMGVPADMIDADTATGSITYANVTQRNLQLLILNLNPAIVRRESVWSRRLLAAPRFVKLNRAALLAMDLRGRYEGHQIGINSRFLAPSEARAHEDLPPFTPEQEAEFERLFASRAPQPPKEVA